MNKRLIAGVVVMILILSGCQRDTYGTTNPTNTETPIQFDTEMEAQNKYFMLDIYNFQEADGFFLGTNSENVLHYYDKASGISGVLCADPSCTHDSEACGAKMDSGASSLSYYDGKLFWIGSEGTQLKKRYLWQSDLSGMNREKLWRFPGMRLLCRINRKDM